MCLRKKQPLPRSFRACIFRQVRGNCIPQFPPGSPEGDKSERNLHAELPVLWFRGAGHCKTLLLVLFLHCKRRHPELHFKTATGMAFSVCQDACPPRTALPGAEPRNHDHQRNQPSGGGGVRSDRGAPRAGRRREGGGSPEELAAPAPHWAPLQTCPSGDRNKVGHKA
jgi:hypothetical protein